ncbi:hypothetical protein ACG83_10770 [Frankia sp. R43]|uniref:hypothetical protein n=1 Tax=Frankia sp. R43 TaxID=269536 RepID=UPI0006CA1ED4|nr:hypothetical protein [Frankia sp. R43]KPM55751.1 hypothetical protein ACG83_10770 [Frankia sp. R43]
MADPYSPDADAETFDLEGWLATFDERLLASPEGRRTLTRLSPLLFALLYCPHHLRGDETNGEITFADFHLALFRHARTWALPPSSPAEHRDVWVAPRNAGKTTLLFLILPLWAAAHGWVRFIAAFADAGVQAEQHLDTFRRELETNTLLRQDYPDLCAPATRPRGTTVADTQHMIQQRGGFVFAARGIDAGVLGMKVGALRPDLLVLDDVEPHEGTYSAYQASKRLVAIVDAILPLNAFARVVVVGTVVMAGSIIHQLVRTITEPEAELDERLAAERFAVHHFAPIVDRGDGTRRSCWPGKWTLAYLESIEHTRSYAKNFANQPVSLDGDYWGPGDIVYADPPLVRALLSIDPATTSKTASHPYGLAVVGLARPAPKIRRCVVRYAASLRLPPADLRTTVLGVLARHPEVGAVLIETNQGGEAWLEILHDLPVRVITVHQSEPKDFRAARTLNHYQRRCADGLPEVVHARRLPAAETEMLAYPRGLTDDVVDATGTGVWFFLDRKKPSGPSGSASTYA